LLNDYKQFFIILIVYIFLKVCVGVVFKALYYYRTVPGPSPVVSMGIFSVVSYNSMCPGSTASKKYQDILGSKDGRCV
jgi:hypothetical protein